MKITKCNFIGHRYEEIIQGYRKRYDECIDCGHDIHDTFFTTLNRKLAEVPLWVFIIAALGIGISIPFYIDALKWLIPAY